MTQTDSDGNGDEKEKERAPEQSEAPQSPTSASQQESKLQKLKRSLSFRTKSLRSKSADNFFQRPFPEVSNSSSTGQLSTIGVTVPAPPEPCYIPPLSPPPITPSGLPLTICSPSRAPRPPDPTAHTFLEHTFKKPHFCDVCNHMIVGNPKSPVPHKESEVRIVIAFLLYDTFLLHASISEDSNAMGIGTAEVAEPPLKSSAYEEMVQEQFGCIKEVMPIACGSKVDPVYEALRFGTSLAQKTKRASASDSPPRNSTSDLAEVPEEAAHCSHAQLTRKHSDNVKTFSKIISHIQMPANELLLWKPVSRSVRMEHGIPITQASELPASAHVTPPTDYSRKGSRLTRRRESQNHHVPLTSSPSTRFLNHTTNSHAGPKLLHTAVSTARGGVIIKRVRKRSDEREKTDEDDDVQKDVLPLNTFVALYRFIPQETQDLEMIPGDRILVLDDSHEDWWKGMIEDRMGFFPASYAHLVKDGDRVFRCNRTFIGCKEQGQITIKEGQICVSSEDERNGFIQVASGKKQGFVPCDVLEDI
ncbi:SH3 and cysteine-rich domain-containing protein [Bagarius yarrelli]|uniref:SH3 and cysteine-rich domain-containing protein n=1 Tax=Bagarius yarrelli TaxID=175774 RepID=A0A556V2X3_BAGYA|nr:SH3 and cysteine-rich domain-containing protein [Bagarius yarrelli]